MKKLGVSLIGLALMFMATPNVAQAGTLTRGVSISPFFAAGTPDVSGMQQSLKYKIAVEEALGIENMYNTYVTNIFENGSSQVNANVQVEQGAVYLSVGNNNQINWGQ